MNTYLAIITTVLVISQIIRVSQNAIQLRRQKILFEKQLKELADMELTERDFETQRKYGELLDTINEKLYQDQKVVDYDRNLKEGILNKLWGEF